jgi:hypothetical protein
MRKLIFLAILAAVALVLVQRTEIERYLKMRQM